MSISFSENQANSRWQSLISIKDAKIALKSLFDITAEDRKKRFMMKCEIDDLKVGSNLKYLPVFITVKLKFE